MTRSRARVAVTPSTPGIRTSITTTSGRSSAQRVRPRRRRRRARRRPRSRNAARSSPRSPARISSWSSTRSTRTVSARLAPGGVFGSDGLDAPAAVADGPAASASAERLGPLAHAGMPGPGARGDRGGSGARVSTTQPDAVAGDLDAHRRRAARGACRATFVSASCTMRYTASPPVAASASRSPTHAAARPAAPARRKDSTSSSRSAGVRAGGRRGRGSWSRSRPTAARTSSRLRRPSRSASSREARASSGSSSRARRALVTCSSETVRACPIDVVDLRGRSACAPRARVRSASPACAVAELARAARADGGPARTRPW